MFALRVVVASGKAALLTLTHVDEHWLCKWSEESAPWAGVFGVRQPLNALSAIAAIFAYRCARRVKTENALSFPNHVGCYANLVASAIAHAKGLQVAVWVDGNSLLYMTMIPVLRIAVMDRSALAVAAVHVVLVCSITINMDVSIAAAILSLLTCILCRRDGTRASKRHALRGAVHLFLGMWFWAADVAAGMQFAHVAWHIIGAIGAAALLDALAS